MPPFHSIGDTEGLGAPGCNGEKISLQLDADGGDPRIAGDDAEEAAADTATEFKVACTGGEQLLELRLGQEC
jgi:hypothetical protein